MRKRSNPWSSRTGIVLTIIFIGGLGFSLWKDRGLAFSPGPLTAKQQQGIILQGFEAHADFEKVCRYCHLPLETTLGEMCLACHTEIANQVQVSEGIHAQFENVHRCQECHSDHRGRDFDPTLAAIEFFDHAFTQFSLTHHQENYDGTPMACNACHNLDDYSAVADSRCQDCHSSHDPEFLLHHSRDFGENCLSCHDGVDRMHEFDHGLVFPLEGRHAEIGCSECHANQVFVGTPTACSLCHAEPEIHAGVFGLACESCHTTTAWAPATLLEHSFPLGHGLEDNTQPTACLTCHPAGYTEYTCYGCHEHQEADITRKHTEEGISLADLPACVDCHASGQEAEDDD